MIKNKDNRTKIILGMLLVIGIFVMIGKNIKAETTKQKEIEIVDPKPILEYKFDEVFEYIFFEEVEMTVQEAIGIGMKGLEQKEETEKVKVLYPKVLVTQKAVKFLDVNGKVERLKSKSKDQKVSFYSSETGNMIINGYLFEVTNCSEPTEIINKEGKVVKTIDGESEIQLSGNGKYAVVDEDICKLYDASTGKELWAKKLEIFSFWDGMDDGLIHILYDGKVVVVKREIDGKKGENIGVVILIDIDGKIVWEKEIENAIYEIFSTKDGKIIIYADSVYGRFNQSDDDEIYILYGFNEKGNMLWKPKEYIGIQIDDLFVFQNTNILYGLHKGYLFAMNILTGNILWQQNFNQFPDDIKLVYGPKPDEIYEVSSNGKYLLLEGAFLLDGKTGKVLKRFKNAGGKILGTDYIWRMKNNKIEIINISDILGEQK